MKLPGAAAAAHYGARMQDVATAMAGVVLPPRGPRGSRQNDRRMRIARAAFHQTMVAAKTSAERRRHRALHCALCRVRVPKRS